MGACCSGGGGDGQDGPTGEANQGEGHNSAATKTVDEAVAALGERRTADALQEDKRLEAELANLQQEAIAAMDEIDPKLDPEKLAKIKEINDQVDAMEEEVDEQWDEDKMGWKEPGNAARTQGSSTFFSDLGHHIDVFMDTARNHLKEYWMWYLIAMIIIFIIVLLLWYRKRLMAMCKARRRRKEVIEEDPPVPVPLEI